MKAPGVAPLCGATIGDFLHPVDWTAQMGVGGNESWAQCQDYNFHCESLNILVIVFASKLLDMNAIYPPDLVLSAQIPYIYQDATILVTLYHQFHNQRILKVSSHHTCESPNYDSTKIRDKGSLFLVCCDLVKVAWWSHNWNQHMKHDTCHMELEMRTIPILTCHTMRVVLCSSSWQGFTGWQVGWLR